ncbi:MAG: hypothetical protein O7F73_20320 [Gammaproteobacteria bacterium]|nr:hypothetical protein [Gammaproteobacteria bacterium]
MELLAIFGSQLVLSLVVYTLIAKWYVVPWLVDKPLEQALTVLIFPHALRHLGLMFFVPGVVADSLPGFFAYTVAFGDLIAGLLAIGCLVALRNAWALAIPLVWLFNVVGSADLLNALRQAEAVPYLGAAWYIPTFWVPVLLVTHVMIFSRLLSASRRQLTVATS